MHWHADDADGADWGLIFIVEFLIVGQRPHRTRKAVDKPLLANTYASWGGWECIGTQMTQMGLIGD